MRIGSDCTKYCITCQTYYLGGCDITKGEEEYCPFPPEWLEGYLAKKEGKELDPTKRPDWYVGYYARARLEKNFYEELHER
jgi:hypothetical protein